MNVETVLSRFQGVRRNGAGWMARCSAHPDRWASLSIRQGDGGRVLLHCFAGCAVEVICEAAGFEVRDLFREPCALCKPEPPVIRDAQKQLAGLRSRLTPADREREVTVVLAERSNVDVAIARALALAIEGELTQVAFKDGEQ